MNGCAEEGWLGASSHSTCLRYMSMHPAPTSGISRQGFATGKVLGCEAPHIQNAASLNLKTRSNPGLHLQPAC
jgi:hypothetical protein